MPRIATSGKPSASARLWAAFGLLLMLAVTFALPSLGLSGCKQRVLVLSAERKAQMGGEFIRVYDDGYAEYGYGVVSDKLKAKGGYRYSGDTLYFLDESFRPHFPQGFVVLKAGVLFMESGFHFL